MNAILGVLFHFIGGFASGSFYIPFKKVKGWNWESFWIIGGLFSWLIVPPIAAYLTIPDFGNIITNTDSIILGIVYVFGVLWGIGGLTYGLGVRFLGVSLGSSIILGLCMIFGALIPAIFYDFKPTPDKDTFSQMLATDWGRIVLMGLVVCIVGIIVSGKAGMMKEKELSADASKNTSSEYKFTLGMIVAVVSGVLSACFNFGLEGGQIMATMANDIWKAANPDQGEFLFRNNVVYVVLLWGGLTTNFIWCMILNARNKSFGNYIDKQTPLIKNYVFSALAGTTWFLQFFFYGMGESKLGNGPSSWILHMAFIILIANLWGLVLNEWKMVNKKTRNTMVTGIAIIIISILIVGYGNNLHK
ncbi:MAG: L-rhamnose/proton symporter RhaT [Sphingobacteriales bacterium]|jgi:L-rhamnose-H+ transport protein